MHSGRRSPGRATSAPRTPTAAAQPDRLVRLLVALAVAAITFSAFVPALFNGYVWDDDAYLHENEAYHGLGWTQLRWMFTTFHVGHYMPLTWVSWAADYLLWGENPLGYHLGNLVLHAINALVFLLVADRLLALAMPAIPARVRYGAAAVAALLFGVHPLRVESVAWATERKDCLSGLFYLLTILLYLRAAVLPRGRPRSRLMAATGVAFGLALLAKVMSVSLPLVMLALDVYPLRRIGTKGVGWLTPSARRVWFVEKAPFFLMAAVAAAPAPFAAAHAQTLGWIPDLGPADRLAISLFSLAFYPPKMLLPTGLSTLYEMPLSVNPLSLKYLGSGAMVVAVTAGLVVVRRRWPAGLAAWWCYGVILLPVMGIVQVGPQIAADRYTYLSCLGWVLLIGAGMSRAWQAAGSAWRRIGIVIPCAAAVAGLWGLTWRQCGFWRDQQTLWSRAVEVDDDCSICHYNLGTALIHDGEADRAVRHFREALRVDPKAARAEHNWGVALSDLGRWPEAIAHYRAAIDIDPDYAAPHRSLAAVLNRQGQPEDAIVHYERVRELEPHDAETLSALGQLLSATGRTAEAAERYREALRIEPNNAETRNNFAIVLGKLGFHDEAIRQAEYAIRIRPSYAGAYHSLANALSAVGRLEQAVSAYREAIRLNPALAAAHCNLGNLLEKLGRSDEATRSYREALRLDPKFAQAHNNLANLLVSQGRVNEALSHYESAILIDPRFGEAYANLGAVLAQQRRYGEALSVLREGHRTTPENAVTANKLAWLLATCPAAPLRDGELAVKLSQAAAQATQFQDLRVLDTLAAAYAEVGRYAEAAQIAGRAVNLARSTGKTKLAERIQSRLELYRAGLPYRLPPGPDQRPR